jgi:phage gpG-like protein
MQFVAEAGVAEVQERILSSKESPSGEQWAPWAVGYSKYRERQGNEEQGLLYDKGRLLASIIGVATRTRVEIKSVGVPYSSFIQDGTSRMPARPYLGWSEVSLASLEQDAYDLLAMEL